MPKGLFIFYSVIRYKFKLSIRFKFLTLHQTSCHYGEIRVIITTRQRQEVSKQSGRQAFYASGRIAYQPTQMVTSKHKLSHTHREADSELMPRLA